jgi:hypothetical protein
LRSGSGRPGSGKGYDNNKRNDTSVNRTNAHNNND